MFGNLSAAVFLFALTPTDAYRLIDDLFSPSEKTRAVARETLIAANDPTIAPALVEIVFFSSEGRRDAVAILESIFAERHGEKYKPWVEAIGRREDLTPKPGYVAFKAKQYAKIDPAFAEFLRDDLPRTIRVEEIVFGGVKKDGIPALERPKTIPAEEATYLTDDEMIFGIALDGVHRAYPQRILDWHEMVNDAIGSKTISLSYCTLCGSAIAFDTTLGQRERYTFGSSGLLYRSNKLMYDRQTNTLWSNLTGEPVYGRLVGKGKKLPILPITVTTWREWRERHRDSEVLSLDTGYRRDYRPGAAYGRYFASSDTMFPVWRKPPANLAPKEWIWSVEVAGRRKVYPLKALLAQPIVHDRVGETSIVLINDAKSEAVRVYRSGDRRFRADLVDQYGERFTLTEEALVGGRGSRLARVPGHRAYWFGWNAFFPGTELWTP